MALISLTYVFAPNTIIKSAEVNANLNTIVNAINGALDTTNLSATASIVGGQLANPITLADGQLRMKNAAGETWVIQIDNNGGLVQTRMV